MLGKKRRMVRDFTLQNHRAESFNLRAKLADGPVCLVFFPLAFSPVCSAELTELEQQFDRFRAAGVTLAAVSVDSPHALREYREQQGLSFELLSDFWPHGAVAKQFGAFNAERGHATRTTVFIGSGGALLKRFTALPGTKRSIDDYLRALESVAARPA